MLERGVEERAHEPQHECNTTSSVRRRMTARAQQQSGRRRKSGGDGDLKRPGSPSVQRSGSDDTGIGAMGLLTLQLLATRDHAQSRRSGSRPRDA
jgi:hypothetical protein